MQCNGICGRISISRYPHAHAQPEYDFSLIEFDEFYIPDDVIHAADPIESKMQAKKIAPSNRFLQRAVKASSRKSFERESSFEVDWFPSSPKFLLPNRFSLPSISNNKLEIKWEKKVPVESLARNWIMIYLWEMR